MKSVPRRALRRTRMLAVALGLAVAMTPGGVALAQDDGVASLPVAKGPFPDTQNMRFLSQISPEDLGALPFPGSARGLLNDIWGWTSPAGEEYALIGNTGGLAVVRITDPDNPVFLGRVPSPAPGEFTNLWGDPKTFRNFAYFTTEVVDAELRIIDLAGLDALGPAPSSDFDLPVPTFGFSDGGYRSAHNIMINEESGFAYVAGVRLAAGAANNACGLEEPPRSTR